MTRKGFKNRLKVTRDSIEKFCHDLKFVRILSHTDRDVVTDNNYLISDDEDDELSSGFYKTMNLEKLDLSSVGPSYEPKDEENIPLISTPRKQHFDLPRSPRCDSANLPSDRPNELKIYRRKSLESPRAFLNGQSGISSIPAIARKEILTSDVLLVSYLQSYIIY
ncbi:unnamed protein product [Caenorhabditis angaria]|uniref:Uncharacterized protein n=1 Tax=Caenorhabditis angaria TaxID=860376 RepID=A0A9P1N9Y3_9PELO|nr:unnamed protein product [Caenorhabditis angaria]